MSDLDALFAAIVSYPAEDTPRLLYADALQEAGDDARAEFIRAQVGAPEELVRVEIGGPQGWYWDGERIQPWMRPYLLFESHRHADWYIRRGFIERITCTAPDWFAHADAVTAAHPLLRDVQLTTIPGRDDFAERHGFKSMGEFLRFVRDNAGKTVAEMLAYEWPGFTIKLPSPFVTLEPRDPLPVGSS